MWGLLATARGVRRDWFSRQRSPWWIELAAISWLYLIYDRISDLAPLRQQEALAHGRGILHLERIVHLAPELSLNHWLLPHHLLAEILANYYDIAHFVVTIGLLMWLWWRRPDLHRPLRNTLMFTNVIGLVVFWAYPLAPPRLLAGSGFTDVVASTHAFASWHVGVLASQANQLAAMPSLHVAWSAWCAIVLWRVSRRALVRGLALAYPLMTSFAVVATGNHFVADVLAGVLTTAMATGLAAAFGALIALRRQQMAAAPSPA
ncbi:MAG: phosphatase PAP2 family protein [Solirubrobacteraceae bacterium]|nr:MAG: inositol phosphorylceramide synthase [Solirubrobacterales bacterium]